MSFKTQYPFPLLIPIFSHETLKPAACTWLITQTG
jgi:hypothetical protein